MCSACLPPRPRFQCHCGAWTHVTTLEELKCSACGWSSKTGASGNNKFGAVKKQIDGHTFDSTREAMRYCELVMLQKAGDIRELCVHPTWKIDLGGGKMRVYEGDFSYIDRAGELVVEDVKCKATITPMYRVKRAAMLEQYRIRIREVM